MRVRHVHLLCACVWPPSSCPLHTHKCCSAHACRGPTCTHLMCRNISDSNLNGEGTIMGGVLVVKPNGVAWMHVERSFFGDFPPTTEVVAAAKAAVAAA